MKPKTKVHIWSIVVATTGAVLTFGATIKEIPGLPGWLTQAWPFVFFLATLIDRVGSAVVDSKAK
jgi:hypothetical protein